MIRTGKKRKGSFFTKFYFFYLFNHPTYILPYTRNGFSHFKNQIHYSILKKAKYSIKIFLAIYKFFCNCFLKFNNLMIICFCQIKSPLQSTWYWLYQPLQVNKWINASFYVQLWEYMFKMVCDSILVLWFDTVAIESFCKLMYLLIYYITSKFVNT